MPGKAALLLHTPALGAYADFGTGPIQEICYSDGTLSGGIYVISGPEIYLVSNGTATLIGSGLPDGSVNWAASQIEIALCIGGKGYIIDTSGVNEITDPDFPSVTSVAHINGYFLWTTTRGQFIWSEINDGQDYDALDFATAEKAPDELVAVLVDHEQVILFGSSTFEVWVPTGNSLSAFEPIPGGLQQCGLASRDSLAQLDNSVFFVGNDKLVYRLEGTSPVRISTFGIEGKLSAMNWANRANLKGMTYAHDGHTYYGLEIPDEGTYFYDVATNMWHQRRSKGITHWGAWVLRFIEGETYAGDRTGGYLYKLDHDALEDRYGYIERMATAGVTSEGGFVPVTNLTLDITTGKAPLTGQGSNPKVMLRYSDDLGSTWSRPVARSFGKRGEYNKKPRWNGLGSIKSPGRVYEFRVTDPVPVIVYGARQNVPIP